MSIALSFKRVAAAMVLASAAAPLQAQRTARAPAAAATGARRAIKVSDILAMRSVRDVQFSPDGEWVAYVVSTLDSARDRSNSDIYMARWDGSRTMQLTYTPTGESAPRFSPDGRYLSFVASRGEKDAESQIWLLDRDGGEARKLTDLKGGVSAYEWSPDGQRIVVESQDPRDTTATSDSARKPKPIVVDRYHFKDDDEGYLGNRRTHLYLVDVATKATVPLTRGRFNETDASWSPDGKAIAFVSDQSADPDRSNDSNIYVVEARAGAPVKKLTTWNGPDAGRPAWSPDGKWIAYLQGSEPKFWQYNLDALAIVPAAGGEARVLTASLDRPVSEPAWTADGTGIVCLVTDDRQAYPVRVTVADGAVARLVRRPGTVSDFAIAKNGRVAVLAATDSQPNEIFALEQGRLRAITHENDAWLAQVALATTEDFSARTADGTEVHGLMVKPAGYKPGTPYPTLLRIHGGPNGQDSHAFSFERQLFAANGYVVLAVNYRGSSGRGGEYQRAIFADWGNREVQDLMAAVDYAVSSGVADSTRLGVGGWSYGGILTDYLIASTTRFKAATSGAGVGNVSALYGVDEYIYQYDFELGPPWKNQDTYLRIAYPFWHADRIRTPTLFLGGEADFNVPLVGGEQMYQALRSLGVDTQLIVYPDSHHGITTPSYQVDRYERYLAWYAKYLRAPRSVAQ